MTDESPLPLGALLDLSDPAEWTDAARILDAGANRAREAMRVLEDFVRFSLNDPFLSRQFKQLRHDLAEAFADVSPNSLLAARDTLADVGTEIGTPQEATRQGIRDVVQANMK